MPYDTVCHGATGALNGWTGLTSKAVSPYIPSTTTTKLPAAGTGGHNIVAAGGTSVTKTKGARVKGSQSRSSNYFQLPASVHLMGAFMRNIWAEFDPLETLTVEMDNTNVAEYSMFGMDLADDFREYPRTVFDAKKLAGPGELHCVYCSLTPAAQVTMFSGEAGLDTVAQETNGWLVRDRNQRYSLLGVIPALGVASQAAWIHVRGLGGEWQGRFPGVPLGRVSSVTFDVMTGGEVSLFREPIPFTGEGLPLLSMFADGTTANPFGLLLIKHKG